VPIEVDETAAHEVTRILAQLVHHRGVRRYFGSYTPEELHSQWSAAVASGQD
jgi:hypothetical protein